MDNDLNQKLERCIKKITNVQYHSQSCLTLKERDLLKLSFTPSVLRPKIYYSTLNSKYEPTCL